MPRRWPTFFGGYRSILRTPPYSVNHYDPGLWETIGMENERERPQSHEDREAQKLVKRIEERQASQESARKADTKAPEHTFEPRASGTAEVT
jgi:hypothetical protein